MDSIAVLIRTWWREDERACIDPCEKRLNPASAGTRLLRVALQSSSDESMAHPHCTRSLCCRMIWGTTRSTWGTGSLRLAGTRGTVAEWPRLTSPSSPTKAWSSQTGLSFLNVLALLSFRRTVLLLCRSDATASGYNAGSLLKLRLEPKSVLPSCVVGLSGYQPLPSSCAHCVFDKDILYHYRRMGYSGAPPRWPH